MTKKGVLLINLGTPDHCNTKSVRRYLKEFLLDPRVIDIPAIFRWILVNLVILPFRSSKSAAAYQKIWLHSGSPLLVHGVELQQSVSHELGSDYHVELGMRYGNPSIESALDKLKDCDNIFIIPLFPQYSSAANGSAIEKSLNILAKKWNIPALTIVRDFYKDHGFISAYADIIKKTIGEKKIDLVLFSYHGLPERHITKSECLASCDRLAPCPKMNDDNIYCYRAQCYETTSLITDELNLSPEQYRVSFQSRLGRTPWIKPYTDLILPELIAQGIKNIAIVCPSFVADCLETLEEINIRAREQWKMLGGEEFTFIPCLNDHPVWVKSLAKMIINEPLQRDTYKDMVDFLAK